ncbi:nucleotide exchange factor GrpE [Candidatus Peregrinibacteria bacterium]|nr:nucleotide exchange factor GrpE [Candidatus Peregrinibacteria bacterium]
MNNTSSDPNQNTVPPSQGQGSDQNAGSGSGTQPNPAATNGNPAATTNPDPVSQPGGSTGDSLADSLVIALTNENEALKSDIEQAKKQLDDMLKISQNALADLQNFRRRSEEEKNAFVEYANAGLIKSSVLPFLDNMHRALTHEPKDAEWAKGVEQSMQLFEKALATQGLKAYDSVGQKLDPKIHEVVMMAPGEKDIILQEAEKGFMLGDKVLKPAKVIVGNGEAA